MPGKLYLATKNGTSTSNSLPRGAASFETTGILDADGKALYRAASASAGSVSSGDGDGSSTVSDIAGLKKNVGFLNWAVGLMFLAGLGSILASFLVLDDRINDRFERADDRAGRIEGQIGDLRVTAAQQSSDIKAILEKVDVDQSATGKERRSDR